MPNHDEEMLRRFLSARTAGDQMAAERYWAELLTLNFDRIRGLVSAYSHRHLSEDERQEAFQRSLIKINERLVHTFEGTSIGEWVNAVKQLVKFKCGDVMREAARHSSRTVALDTDRDPDQGPEHLDRALYAAIEKHRQLEQSEDDDARTLADRQRFLDWAVPRLTPQRRAVLELDRRGVPVEQIERELGVSRDVVYANRSRAVKDLAKLREDYHA